MIKHNARVPVTGESLRLPENVAEAAANANKLEPKTVVKKGYKFTYQDRAKAAGHNDKASKRGCGDWLQRELQAETVDKSGKFDMARFIGILECNGVDYSRWKTEGHGWEGRFRMSGSIVLRGRVGKSARFVTPDSEVDLTEIPEAADFLAKWGN